MSAAIHPMFGTDLPKGISRARALPDAALGALWDSIFIDEGMKKQLLSQAMLNFSVRGKVDRTIIPLHGVILLTGEPGTGKTSLARGLAHRTAASFSGARFKLLEVEPHSLTSSAMGKTQRAVTESSVAARKQLSRCSISMRTAGGHPLLSNVRYGSKADFDDRRAQPPISGLVPKSAHGRAR